MVVDEAIRTQLRKGVLEYCVLSVLRAEPAYGLELAGKLTARGLLASEGSLYPLLARLRKNGMVETVWRESTSGPPRGYYQLTPAGETSLAAFTHAWASFSAEVNQLLKETR